MASFSGHLTDSLVVIYDVNGVFLTKTIVTSHDKSAKLIEVAEGLDNVKIGARFHLLIVHPDGASEFGGTLRGSRKGVFEIAIFGEKQRGARGSTRHNLNTSAMIREITVNSKRETLETPVNVIIENISTTGVLINSKEMRFSAGSVLQIEFTIQGKNTLLIGKVVREQLKDDGSYCYGCQLLFLKK